MSEEEKGMPEAKAPEEEIKQEQPSQEKPKPIAGFMIQLEQDGQITRKIYGEQQNIAVLYGLVEVMRNEADALNSVMPGQSPTRTTRLLSHVVTSITNMANVLMGLQAGLNQIIQRMEEPANVEPEQKLQGGLGEEVSPEGPGE